MNDKGGKKKLCWQQRAAHKLPLSLYYGPIHVGQFIRRGGRNPNIQAGKKSYKKGKMGVF